MATVERSLPVTAIVTLILGLSTAGTTWVYQSKQIEVEKAKAGLESVKQKHEAEMEYLKTAVDEKSSAETRRRVLRYLRLALEGPLKTWAADELNMVETELKDVQEKLRKAEEERAKAEGERAKAREERAKAGTKVKSLEVELANERGPRRRQIEKELLEAKQAASDLEQKTKSLELSAKEHKEFERWRVTLMDRLIDTSNARYHGLRVACDGASNATREQLAASVRGTADAMCREISNVPDLGTSAPTLWGDGKGITFSAGGISMHGVQVWCSCRFTN